MSGLVVIFLSCLILGWLLGVVSRALNRRALSPVLPAAFQGWYDEDRYRASQAHARAASRLADVEETVGLVAAAGFILAGGFPWLDGLARSLGLGEIATGLVFLGALALADAVLGLPFDAYAAFVLEERFGFNRTTPGTFVLDRLKGALLAAVLGGPLLAAALWFYQALPDTAWLWSWLTASLFMAGLQYAAPTLIMPLFNRFEPLPAGELRAAIEDYARRQDFHLDGVFVMDGSRRSSRGNAFFTGFGRRKRVALFDTLIKEQTVPEIVAVLAHEIGHYKKGHIPQGMFFAVLRLGAIFLLLSFFLREPALFAAVGLEGPSVHVGLVLFLLLYSPVSLVLDVATNWWSRRREFEADRFAAETTRRPQDLASALKKLSVNNLANLTPHPLYVFLRYSHPPILERMEALGRL